jgi:hypothetical protein
VWKWQDFELERGLPTAQAATSCGRLGATGSNPWGGAGREFEARSATQGTDDGVFGVGELQSVRVGGLPAVSGAGSEL